MSPCIFCPRNQVDEHLGRAPCYGGNREYFRLSLLSLDAPANTQYALLPKTLHLKRCARAAYPALDDKNLYRSGAFDDDSLSTSTKNTFGEIGRELDSISEIINNLLSLNTLMRPERMRFSGVDLGPW
jgi:hypothetical protein